MLWFNEEFEQFDVRSFDGERNVLQIPPANFPVPVVLLRSVLQRKMRINVTFPVVCPFWLHVHDSYTCIFTPFIKLFFLFCSVGTSHPHYTPGSSNSMSPSSGAIFCNICNVYRYMYLFFPVPTLVQTSL